MMKTAENGGYGTPVDKQKSEQNEYLKTNKKFAIMKSMKDFAAQQLTKKQMNEVKGGRVCTAILKTTQEEVSVTVPNDNAVTEIITAGLKIEAQYGDIATNIKCR